MFYSSLLFHKEVNFTLKVYFNQLFSLPPIYHLVELLGITQEKLGRLRHENAVWAVLVCKWFLC
jgi:hypothetical protein